MHLKDFPARRRAQNIRAHAADNQGGDGYIEDTISAPSPAGQIVQIAGLAQLATSVPWT